MQLMVRDKLVEMTLIRAGEDFPVEQMFDDTGSETFDPTEASEVHSEMMGLTKLLPDDEIRIQVSDF